MAIAGKANSVFIFENCLLPDLKAISPVTDPGYYTDLKGNVQIPDMSPLSEELLYAKFTEAAILCWINSIGESSTARGGMMNGNRHWSFNVFFQGGLKADRGIQMKTFALAEDHKRAMDNKPSRDQTGGSVANTYGINTRLSEDYQFHWEKIDQGIGMWTCLWRIDYSTPTTG